MNAIDLAGFTGFACIGYALGGVLGAGVALTVTSIVMAFVLEWGNQ